ncbi:MAG TPA: hypothetical protein VMS11_04675 [Solirubrobacterales bacterium]|nr:hypothetical protein [Solirubrobacterales bacterium]
MTLPAVTTSIGQSLTSTGLPSSTGTAFAVGLAERGPTNEPIPLISMSDYARYLGSRQSWSANEYDTLDVAFDGGRLAQAYFVRCVGPAAKSASGKLKDDEDAETLLVTATSPGAWANTVKVEVVVGTGEKFKLKVYEGSDLKESSPELADTETAVAWAAESSTRITLKDLGGDTPKTGKTLTLSEGTDDRENVDAKVIAKGLALFTADLGGGQVCAPGNTAEAVQLAVIAHCEEMERTPILAAVDDEDHSEVVAQALALSSASGAHQGGVFDPWEIAKGIAPGTFRTVPPEGRVIGQIAAVDAAIGNASQPAAGPNGKARSGGLIVGLARSRSPEEWEALNDAGVNVSIMEDGLPTTYGWRTLADPVTDRRWLPLNVARVMTQIAHEAEEAMKTMMFPRLDKQGKTVARAETKIRSEVLKPLYDGEALFGETEEEAYSVTVTQEINPSDGSVGKLTAQIGAAPVEFAEQINITVVATN